MAVTDQQKIDFLLKKIGFTKTKTGSVVGTGAISGTPKQPFAEAIPSPLIIANDSLWNESALIPATAPTSDTAQVKVYLAATSGHRMTADPTSSGQRAYIAHSTYNNTSSARLNNWIDTQFGSSYLIKVFRGDPNSGGVQLSAAGSGNNDGWFFDYSAGVLNFNDTNVPSGVTDTNIYIVGYRYIGLTGAPTPTGAGNFTFNNLTVTGDIDVDGHTNLDNVSVAGVTTFSGDINVDITSNLSVAAPATFSDSIVFPDNAKAKFGDSSDLSLFHDGFNSFIQDTGTGQLRVQTSELNVVTGFQNSMLKATPLGSVKLYYGASNSGTPAADGDTKVKLETASSGINVVGTTTSTQLAITGVSTFSGLIDANGDLDVDGHTNLDNVSVAGVTTFSGDVITGIGATVGIGSTVFFGNDVEARFGGSAISPGFKISNDSSFTRLASADSVVFTSIGAINIAGQASNTLQSNNNRLTTAGAVEIIETDSTSAYLKHSGNTKLQTTAAGISISEDLDVDGHTNLDNVSIAGVVTATTFIGALTGNASGNAGTATALQTARNIGGVSFDGTSDIDLPGVNIAGNQDTSGTAAGLSGSPSINITNLTAVDGTFSGNVSIGGTLTYEDVTNIDSVGLITARSGIFLPDNQKVQLGNAAGSADLEIYHSGNHSFIDDIGTGNLKIRSNNLRVSNGDESKLYATFTPTAVELYYNNIKRLETTGIGIAVNGKTDTQLLDVNGRANIFDMEVSGISTFAGNVDINVDLDVDGHTNLDNVSVAGVTTFANFVAMGNNSISFDHAGGSQSNQRIFNDGSDFRMRSTSNTGIRIQVNNAGGNNSDITLQTDTIDALVVKGTGEIEIAKDLDVDGHTNLDNVSVAGVTTFASDINVDGLLSSNNSVITVKSPQFLQINNDAQRLRLKGTGVAGAVESMALQLNTHSEGGTTQHALVADKDSSVKIYYSGNKKLETSDKGIQVGTGVTVETNGQATFTGIVTASSFRGDGSQLSGISVDASALKDSNGNVKIQANESGAVHTGISTFQDIDVDGHTNLDNVSVAGVTTFSDDVTLTDNVKAIFGNNTDLQIEHRSGGQSVIIHGGSDDFWIGGTPNGYINITPGYSNTYSARFQLVGNLPGGAKTPAKVELWYGASGTSTPHEKKLETTGYGVTVYGTTQTQQLNVVGVGTFGSLDISGDLDVDGHTNLDNVSVAGVTTFSGGSVIINPTGANHSTFTINSNESNDTPGPIINLSRNNGFFSSTEPLGEIRFVANSNKNYGKITGRTTNTGSGTEDGKIQVSAIKNGTETVVTEFTHNGVDIPFDLDVDGHTNLDNVSVAGITTFNEGLFIPDTKELKIGNSASNPDLKIFNNTASTIIREENSNLDIQASFLRIADTSGNYKLMTNGTGVSIPENLTVSRDFDVDGHTNLDNVSVAGVTTFTGDAEFDSDARFDSTITAGGGTGNNGQYLKSTGHGVAWESFPTMRTTTTVTASAGQTTFSFTYNVGFLDVFINGTKLTDSEFTATNGSSVVLAVGCFVGDIVELVSYNTVSGGGGSGAGSITVQDEGSSLSTGAETLNFVGTGVVASGTGPTKTITINTGTADTTNISTNNLNVVGFATFAQTVLVKNNSRLNFRDANTAIYHDGNFRIESAGSGGDLILKTNAAGGNSNDVVLHGGSVGELLRAHGTGDVDITNTLGIGGSITKASGHLDIRASNLSLKNANNSATYASFTDGGSAELNHNNTKRLETLSNGVNVIGSLFVNGSAIGGGGGGSGFFSQTVAGIHTLSKVGIGTADPEFDLDLGSYISSGVGVAATIRIIGRGFGGNPYATAIRFGAGSNNVDYTLLRVDGQDGTTDGDGNTDLGFALRYMSAGESGTDNRLAFWADNTTKTKYEALSIYNDGRVLVDNGASGGHGFHGHPPDHFTVRGSSKLDNVRVVGVSTFQNVLPQTDSTYDIGTNTVRFRNIYADTLYGDGSNLTGISGGGGSNVGITTNLSGSFSATPGSPTTINTLSGYSSDDLVVEYTIYIKNGSNIQTQKLLAMRDGTTIDSTQFAVMFSSSLLAQFDATISSGNILLRATPESGITGNITYKIKREVM